MVAAVNERLLNAVISSREFTIGALRLRCLQCHIGPGWYAKSGSPGIHQHDVTQIEIPLSAHFDFTVDNARIALMPAEALVIPRNKPHNWETPGGFMMGIMISSKAPSGVDVDLPLTRGGAPLVVKNRAVTSHIQQLVDLAASNRSSAFTPGLCSYLLMVLNGAILDAVCEIPNHPEATDAGPARSQLIYERITAFIKSNLGNSLNSPELVIQAGVGFRQLTRIFVQHCGEPPHSYILRLRLNAAQEILDKDPLTPLKMVAYDCGFSSASHFTSTFKKKLGVAPGVYATRRVVR